jgi:tetrahydromethanopterin S-methyltransferase subunit C
VAACRSGNWQIRDLIVSGFWAAQIAEPLGAMAERFLAGAPSTLWRANAVPGTAIMGFGTSSPSITWLIFAATL